MINTLAAERGEWAGYPQPLEGLELVIEPRHPLYKTLNGAHLGERQQTYHFEHRELTPAEKARRIEFVNAWYSRQHSGVVSIYRENGRAWHTLTPDGFPQYRALLLHNTTIASGAWSIEAELAALETLRGLVKPHLFDLYFLTGVLLETSPRSGVVYFFRKLRPTLAWRPDRRGLLGVIASLCMHPIGYYRESFAGSMVPTDDVIAHLLLMRGDERKFWAKANHHDLWRPESGL